MNDSVVTGEWPASLSVVNSPTSLEYLSPGQCVRVGVVVTGSNQQQLLATMRIGLQVRFSGQQKTFDPQAPAAVRRVKPKGYDFVAGVLHSANVPTPELEMASLAASASQWCVPADAAPGRIEFAVSAVTGEKTIPLKIIVASVDSFTTPEVPFKTDSEATQFIMTYHFAPRPALLVTAARQVPPDHQADPNMQQFFVSAFRENPQAASLLGPQIAACPRPTQLLLLSLLAKASVSLLTPPALDQEEKNVLAHAPPLSDPYDTTPNRELWSRLDLLWSEFFATGRIEPVRAIAHSLAWRKDYDAFVEIKNAGQPITELTESIVHGLTFSAAGWSLGSFQRTDGLAADYIDAIAASPDTSPEIRKQLVVLQTDPAFRK